MFFALATSIYRDYKLESQIQNFRHEIDNLATLARQKPEDVKYFDSVEYKDHYAKENLNLLNPDEKLIIIPEESRVVKRGPVEIMTDRLATNYVLNLSNRSQWWEYFFGHTLSVEKKQRNDDVTTQPTIESDSLPTEDNTIDEESVLDLEG